MLRHRSLDCARKDCDMERRKARSKSGQDNTTTQQLLNGRTHEKRVIKIDYLLCLMVWSSSEGNPRSQYIWCFLIKTFQEENMVINFVLESNSNQVATPADICDYNYDMFYFYLQDVREEITNHSLRPANPVIKTS